MDDKNPFENWYWNVGWANGEKCTYERLRDSWEAAIAWYEETYSTSADD